MTGTDNRDIWYPPDNPPPTSEDIWSGGKSSKPVIIITPSGEQMFATFHVQERPGGRVATFWKTCCSGEFYISDIVAYWHHPPYADGLKGVES